MSVFHTRIITVPCSIPQAQNIRNKLTQTTHFLELQTPKTISLHHITSNKTKSKISQATKTQSDQDKQTLKPYIGIAIHPYTIQYCDKLQIKCQKNVAPRKLSPIDCTVQIQSTEEGCPRTRIPNFLTTDNPRPVTHYTLRDDNENSSQDPNKTGNVRRRQGGENVVR